MSTVILAALGAVCLVLYVLKRRARLRAEEGNDTY
jgi:hypothetical protein